MMPPATIFFSWQSDIRRAANHTLIENALRAAAKDIANDPELQVEPVVDRDTQGLAGSPNIRDAIFEKIHKASVFVADVTPVATGPKGRLCPNPNVMIELGYAAKSIGWSRIVLVLNTAFGQIKDLPFDLQGHRCMTYESLPEVEERAAARKDLQRQFGEALLPSLKSNEQHLGKYPAQLTLSHVKRQPSTGERHNYELIVDVKNAGDASLRNWAITVEVPTLILDPDKSFHGIVASRSSEDRTFFRFKGSDYDDALHPGDSCGERIPYYVDTAMYRGERPVLSQFVIAKAYVNDELVGEIRKKFDDLNNF